ncbi:HIT domain-containing protein [archaeon]|jgi:diadenosine tetraphosphate (Ap4A) HIT family hydrolase|nr:HIT domain-containing protein [archaeon]MBT6761672.1 HIT domain-containing protein [archaeon]
MEDVEQLIIKKYQFWDIMLHPNQCHLGRCILWCKRKDADDFIETTSKEREEFFKITKDLNNTLTELWQPDRMNYASLGNRTNHLHIHIIPRYQKDRSFLNTKFTDERWSKNYAPYDKTFSIPNALREKIKNIIEKNLKNKQQNPPQKP